MKVGCFKINYENIKRGTVCRKIIFQKIFIDIFSRNYELKYILKVFFTHEYRFLYFFRKYQGLNNRILKLICKIFIRQIRLKYGIEISVETNIGEGFI